jgi:hypothetical protein
MVYMENSNLVLKKCLMNIVMQMVAEEIVEKKLIESVK